MELCAWWLTKTVWVISIFSVDIRSVCLCLLVNKTACNLTISFEYFFSSRCRWEGEVDPRFRGHHPPPYPPASGKFLFQFSFVLLFFLKQWNTVAWLLIFNTSCIISGCSAAYTIGYSKTSVWVRVCHIFLVLP